MARRMPCYCWVSFLGYIVMITTAFVWYKAMRAFLRIIGPYMIYPGINLKKRAKGEWAVVTGATDGIGKGYAFELARKGFNIILISRSQEKLDNVKNELLGIYSNVKVKTFVFDFAKSKDAKEYQSMIEDVNKLEVGILINNVGTKYTHPELLHGMKDDLSDISNIIAVNTMPVTLLTSALLPQMVQRKGGVVVNISSFSGLYPMSHWSVYSSTKQYVRWLSNILRQEYARKGIIVQTICPGLVVTNMTKKKEPSFFIPDAISYARQAVGTIGISDETTGYMTHQLQVEILKFLPWFIRNWFIDSLSRNIRKAYMNKKKKAKEAKEAKKE
ncbi:hypothetical protein WR25_01006 [Diploscapter pachys]|uniref:Very-long-chain 3-oxoacyl-CoA reductase n=1 Tax=Diploscapter pachys TaxID=2018661 RepID=A0A2A2KGF3_9BILA|nr:hypothetical protein WR25_01006 [Diploscapter pachys]